MSRVVLAIALGIGLTGVAPLPQASASPWLEKVLALRYVSASGDGVALKGALSEFHDVVVRSSSGEGGGVHAPFVIDNPPPAVTYDRRSGFIELCFGELSGSDCGFDAIVRASDVGVPPFGKEGRIDDPSIGLNFAQLRLTVSVKGCSFHPTTGKAGSVVYVASSCSTCLGGGAGAIAYTEDRCLLENGIVAAHVTRTTE